MWKGILLKQFGADADVAAKVRGQIIVVIRSKIVGFANITIKELDPEKVLASV